MIYNIGEVKEYLKNSEERIESAEVLMNAGKYNDAISRVYYAFFDAATAALLSKDLTTKTHQGLIIIFTENFIKMARLLLTPVNGYHALKKREKRLIMKFTRSLTKRQ